jgi:hypothetical protein
MKTLLRLTVLLAFLSLFSNCKKPTVFKEVQVGSLFTMQVPTYMTATSEAYPFHVTMQYSNDSIPLYLMAMDTLRLGMNENTLKMYYDSIVSQPFIDSVKITAPALVKIGTDSAYTSEMTGIENGVRVFYELEAVATPERYFMVLAWAKLSQREELKPDMLKMLGSFSDISHKKI